VQCSCQWIAFLSTRSATFRDCSASTFPSAPHRNIPIQSARGCAVPILHCPLDVLHPIKCDRYPCLASCNEYHVVPCTCSSTFPTPLLLFYRAQYIYCITSKRFLGDRREINCTVPSYTPVITDNASISSPFVRSIHAILHNSTSSLSILSMSSMRVYVFSLRNFILAVAE